MKKLNLLKPEQRVCFLDGGKGEKVNYLYISDDLTEESLRQDVEAGAAQFEPLLRMVEKARGGISRVVVLRGTNEESLYMAANYLAAICNEQRGLANLGEWEEEEEEIAEDFFSAYEEEEEPQEWYESPFKLPIVDMSSLQIVSGPSFSPFGEDFLSVGSQQNRNQQPFWMSCRREPIAVVARRHDFYTSSYASYLERFQSNPYIFVLLLEGESKGYSFMEDTEEIEKAASVWEQRALQLILETTADVAWVKEDEKEQEEYYELLLENWVDAMGMKFAQGFPKKDITKRIMALRDNKKSALIEKVLKYIQKERRKENSVPLTAEEFDVLRQFKSISEKDPDAKSGSYLQQMDNELVGMESVKKQMKNIVQTMKYGRYREKMGLGKSMFHNVHLMIGAPGTAKTSMAKLLGNAMCEEGILPDNRFICVNGADLKGKYVGHSAPKTKALFEQYDIILIDEAYSLTSSDRGGNLDSFSQEALAQLMIELEEHTTDKLVLFAGYGGTGIAEKDNKMKEFLDANPGLKSRINTTIFFDSYTPEEMVQIVHCQAKQQKFSIVPDADELIKEYFAERFKAADFGNGREARVLLENAVISAAARIMGLPEKKRTKKMLQELTVGDIKEALDRLREGNRLQKGRERRMCGF